LEHGDWCISSSILCCRCGLHMNFIIFPATFSWLSM
jgi:hypothetical protein